MVERLGDVLYWAGCLFAGLFCLGSFLALANNATDWLIISGILAVASYLLGLALRYILKGP